jgi:hypothetical protein
MMTEQQRDRDRVETRLELGASLAGSLALLPGQVGIVGGVIGGVLAQVFAGISSDRSVRRLAETISALQGELERLSGAQEEYVRSEDFEDLCERALMQAADERHEAKRKMYARFIAGLTASTPVAYDERRQQLRTLDELQLRHIEALRMLAAATDDDIAAALSREERAEARFMSDGRTDWVNANREILDQLMSMGLARTASANRPIQVVERSRGPEIEGGGIRSYPVITEYGARFYEFVTST